MKQISFCEEGEENDPSEDYEEYMACAVCGDHCKYETIMGMIDAKMQRCKDTKMTSFFFVDLPM